MQVSKSNQPPTPTKIMANASFWRKREKAIINNQYHLQEFLGSGGYGAVYKANEVIRDRLIREVAIKLIASEEDETKAEKQLNELQAAVNLQHENLIRSYTSGSCEVKEDEYLFIVMEIAETTLEKKLKTGKLSITEVQEIVQATAAALNYLHKSEPRKVHRDIKPANLLYAGKKWKLSDLGLLREISSTSSLRTQDMKGTPPYVPPESYDGVVGTGWDMWSLGIMTAEILTGTLPFIGNTDQELMKKIMEQQPEIDWSKIPEPFTAIVRGCLEKERAERWTAEQVLTALVPKKSVVELLKPSDFLAPDFLAPNPSPTPYPERSRRAAPAPNQVPLPEPNQVPLPAPPERSRRAAPDPDRIDQLLASIFAPIPTQPIPAPPAARVVSAVGMDYINLRNLLAAKKWKEADDETVRVMLKVAGRQKEEWHLGSELIKKFPCEDLRTIDQLWVEYSNGHFGFSVQKRIYQSLGGTSEYDEKVWKAFADTVGWRLKRLKNDNATRVYYEELTFSDKAPKAHLPSLGVRNGWGVVGSTPWNWHWVLWTLFSRIETCRL